MRGWYFDHIIIEISSIFFSSSDDSENRSIAGLDLLDIRVRFITQNSLEIEYDCWHFWADERERTMLEFPTRITLCMEIGEFFEFQRTFCCRTVEEIASEKEKVLIFRVFLYDRIELLRILELFFEFERHLLHLSDNLANILHLKVPLLTE